MKRKSFFMIAGFSSVLLSALPSGHAPQADRKRPLVKITVKEKGQYNSSIKQKELQDYIRKNFSWDMVFR